MTEEQALKNAARVLKNAEKAATTEAMGVLNDIANSWLRLAGDIRWSENDKKDREANAQKGGPVALTYDAD